MDEAPRALRNIGILAHIDAGKTSLTERILYVSGRIRRAGDIDEGTTVTDYLDVERERGITVKAATAQLEWRGGLLNLIDTPGHVDFGSEVERSLRALDGAVVLLCAVAGVQSRTETLYRACLRRGAARIAFVNKMDRRGASFSRSFEDFARILDPGAIAVQMPWGEGELFRGVVDLVTMSAFDFRAAAGEGAQGPDSLELYRVPLPSELEDGARAARSILIERLASGSGGDCGDEGILEDYVAGRDCESAKLAAALRAATLAGRATPVLCGSAFSAASAALLLDAALAWLPAPEEAAFPEATDPLTGASLRPAPGDPFSGLVFKTGLDPHFGRLSWTRLWSGALAAGDRILDARAGRAVRVAKLFRIQADRIEEVEAASAGDIVAIALGGGQAALGAGQGGAESALGSTGATLCDPKRPLLYELISFAEPVVSLAIEPKSRSDGAALLAGVAALADEDPSLRWREDPQTGRVELSGMGELHLEVAVERLARDHGARIRSGAPRVAFRESLAGEAVAREDFDRDLGGERSRASVSLRLAPGREGSGIVLRSAPGLRAAPALMDAVRRGAEAALSVGPAAGFPLGDAELLVLELSAPGAAPGTAPGASRAAERAAEIAASLAAGRAAREAGSRVSEPVMRLDVTVPTDYLGAAAAAISGRGGRIEAVEEAAGGASSITAAAPLRRLFGFAGELRSSSQGRADCLLRFLRYEPVPKGFSDFS